MQKRALVLGLGVSGKAAASLLAHKGYEVVGIDRNPNRQDIDLASLTLYGEEELPKGERFSLAVVSPGIGKGHPLLRRLEEEGVPILGEVDLAFRFLSGRAVAITGTNGKTTVTSLVEHVLLSCGHKARALGNIGSALTAYALAPDEEEILVVELSSYQLETLDARVFDCGVLLNITPDHLDRYSGMEEYAKAKAKLQDCIKEGGAFYLSKEVAKEYPHLFRDEPLFFEEEDVTIPLEYPAVGEHDRDNARAAFAICKHFCVSEEAFSAALKTFRKPAHRIEFVRNCKGVSYYDDSKGTNIDAVIRAVSAMKGKVLLIVGGVDKGSSYLPWKRAFEGKVRKIFAIGQAAKKISDELGLFFNVQIVDSLEKAVKESYLEAREGEVVLLSPGCSSFDMFRDYAHRGEEFQKFVGLLEEE